MLLRNRYAKLRSKSEFLKEFTQYKSINTRQNTKYELSPQLDDRTTETGFDAHYTYQGPWVMRKLIQAKPKKHIDVGSWVTYLGFFSALQPTEFVDIRPARLDIPGLSPKAGSVLDLPFKPNSVLSLSCLHVVEHVGLGRYGDPLDPEGTTKAITALTEVIAKNGNLYLSLPVGREVTYFNAHRVTNPAQVVDLCKPLKLKQLSAVMDDGRYIERTTTDNLADQKYALGLYHFVKE